MPQFQIAFFTMQIFWLLVVLYVAFMVMRFAIWPLLMQNERILEDMQKKQSLLEAELKEKMSRQKSSFEAQQRLQSEKYALSIGRLNALHEEEQKRIMQTADRTLQQHRKEIVEDIDHVCAHYHAKKIETLLSQAKKFGRACSPDTAREVS